MAAAGCEQPAVQCWALLLGHWSWATALWAAISLLHSRYISPPCRAGPVNARRWKVGTVAGWLARYHL
jgi:hypothetical protein